MDTNDTKNTKDTGAKTAGVKDTSAQNTGRKPRMPKQKKSGRILFNIIFAAMLTAAICGALWYGFRRFTAIRFETKTALVSSELKKCAELTVVKNNYSDIVTLKKSAVFGMAKSYAIVRYSGVVRAGIPDLSAASFAVSSDCKSVTVHLPPVSILGNDISAFEVFDESQNLFVPISTQEVFNGIDRSKLDMLDSLVAGGLLAEAQDYCARLIERLLSAMNFEQVAVDFMLPS